jgi:hypothetical protein
MLIDYPEKILLRKFCNLGRARTQQNLDSVSKAVRGEISLPYNSISLHEYLSADDKGI